MTPFANVRRYAGMLISLATMMAIASTFARAQEPAGSFSALSNRVVPDQVVVITDASGGKTVGRVAEVSSSSLVVLTRATNWTGRQTFLESEVSRIHASHRIWDGPLIGAAIGAAASAIFSVSTKESERRDAGTIIGLGAGIGAGIGIAVDLSIGPRTLFAAPGRAQLGAPPAETATGRGFVARIRF